MTKEEKIKAAQAAVEAKKAEAKRVDAELTELKLAARQAVVEPETEPEAPEPVAEPEPEAVPNNED